MKLRTKTGDMYRMCTAQLQQDAYCLHHLKTLKFQPFLRGIMIRNIDLHRIPRLDPIVVRSSQNTSVIKALWC